MLAFTLSKINLLILVIAIFAIVSFFLFQLSGSLVGAVAVNLVTTMQRNVFTMVNNETYCEAAIYTIPRALSVDPTASAGVGVYYTLEIKRTGLKTPGGDTLNRVSFIAAKRPRSRESEGEVLGASAFATSADVKFFSFLELDFAASHNTVPPSNTDGLVLDPQAVEEIDSVVVIKERSGAEKFLYFVPCSTTRSIGGRQENCLTHWSAAGRVTDDSSFKCSPGLYAGEETTDAT